MEAARRAKLSQPTISRLETGTRTPTVAEVSALCRAYRAPADVRRALQGAAKDLQAGTTSARIVLQRPRQLQNRIGRIEQSAELLRSFQPGMIIGLVQTRDYARTMLSGALSGDVLEEITRSRMERQAILDTGRRFRLIHTEGALRWHIGGPEVMAAQLEHLAQLTTRDNIELGIIPWNRPVAMSVRHAFHLYDTRTVIVGTESGTAFITDPPEVARYDRRFRWFEEHAVFGAEARAVFARVAAEYRELGEPGADPLGGCTRAGSD